MHEKNNNNNIKLFHLEHRQWSFFCMFVHYVGREKVLTLSRLVVEIKYLLLDQRGVYSFRTTKYGIIVLSFNCLALNKYHLLW